MFDLLDDSKLRQEITSDAEVITRNRSQMVINFAHADVRPVDHRFDYAGDDNHQPGLFQ